jgi:AAA15 family ATPase/GTPase
MIKSIKLQNFKSHKDTELVLKPISIFIGNNNSGKSSTYQSLLLLRDAVRVGQNQLVTIKSPRNNATPETPFMYNEGKSIDVYDYDDVVFKT